MTTPIDRLTAALQDRYRIERELGAGGMATVYLAEDLKHDRKVAIKVLKPELCARSPPARRESKSRRPAAMSPSGRRTARSSSIEKRDDVFSRTNAF
jgi:serine/threonine-protein kinase